MILRLLMLLVALVLCLARRWPNRTAPKTRRQRAHRRHDRVPFPAGVRRDIVAGRTPLSAAASRPHGGAEMGSDVLILLCGMWLVASPIVMGLQTTAVG